MEFKAVLFDFDGTLAETMEDNFRSWKKACEMWGIKIIKDDYFPLEGLKQIEVAKVIAEKHSILRDNFQEIIDFKNKDYRETCDFKLYGGVDEIIGLLKKNKKLIGIVSASPMKKLNETVEKKFLDRFDVIISGDDTIKGKPDPDPYLKAMKELGLKGEECIVVENAPLGIKSAKGAGTYCIGLSTTVSKDLLGDADRVFSDHQELYNFFLSSV